MNVCIFGAGAVGGYLAAQILRSKRHTVSVVARGAHLQAIRTAGLRLRDGDVETVEIPDAASDDPASLPQQDIVFVTLKAPALPAAAASIGRLLSPMGCAVFVTNGIPWWWQFGVREGARSQPRVDPEALIWNGVGPNRCMGCVVYSMNELLEPGVVVHHANNRWIVGEPDNSLSPRLQAVVELLRECGLGAEATQNIRMEVWAKVLRNVSVNPISALTRLDVAQIAAHDGMSGLSRTLAEEVVRTAAAMGWDLSALQRKLQESVKSGGAIDGRKVGSVRPSMLQDVLQGRPMEVDAIVGELQEFARANGVDTPVLDVVETLIDGLDRTLRVQQSMQPP